MRCSTSCSFWAKTRSCRLAIDRTALSTSSECWINTTRCAPQGPYCPESQFFTVRSFAPVHPATVLIRMFLSLNVLSKAEAIPSAKFIVPSKLPPSPFALFGSPLFGKDLPFLGNDIPPSRSVQSGRQSRPPWGRLVKNCRIKVPIEKANQGLHRQFKSCGYGIASGCICPDVDRPPKIFHRKSARHHPALCRAAWLRNRQDLRGYRSHSLSRRGEYSIHFGMHRSAKFQ